MTLVFIALDIALAIIGCIAYYYYDKWCKCEALSKRRLEAFEECRNERDILRIKMHDMRDSYEATSSQLKRERFEGYIFEQKWKNAEEELMKLRDKLPKRDSKGRFCKK